MASGSGQSSFNPYDLCSDDDEYFTPKHVAEMTPAHSDRSAHLLTAARLYLNSPPEAPKNWAQVNPNRNDYHSDPIEMGSIFQRPNFTDWWHQREETYSKYADLSNVAHNIFSIIPHGVRLEASYSLPHDIIGWRQSKTTGETLRKKVIVREYARANNGMLAGYDSVLDMTEAENVIELK